MWVFRLSRWDQKSKIVQLFKPRRTLAINAEPTSVKLKGRFDIRPGNLSGTARGSCQIGPGAGIGIGDRGSRHLPLRPRCAPPSFLAACCATASDHKPNRWQPCRSELQSKDHAHHHHCRRLVEKTRFSHQTIEVKN